MKNGKLGIALVGLGFYSEDQLAPALQQTEHCYLAGIVTGNVTKKKNWQAKYSLPADCCYTYQNFDTILHNDSIDIVYIVLPNALHAPYVVRSAAAGKHVICEKPMAITVDECEQMIAACKNAGVQLSIGYRLHFEPHTLEMIRLSQEKIFGNIQIIKADHGLSYAKGWRLNNALAGGGPLMDVGIYCIQAARYIAAQEPIAVTAQEGFKNYSYKFKEVEESITWQMEFANGIIAHCTSSYVKKESKLRIEADSGWAQLSPAYGYAGIQGMTSLGKINFPQVFQQALQMDDFALCVKEKKQTKVSGEMGLQDVKILQAVYTAMKTGERILIN